jgi:hypothetical protein
MSTNPETVKAIANKGKVPAISPSLSAPIVVAEFRAR